MVIDHVQAGKEELLFSQVVVELRHMRIQLHRLGSIEDETRCVQTVAHLRAVSLILGSGRRERRLRKRVHTPSIREDGGDIGSDELPRSARGVVKFHDALSKVRQRHKPCWNAGLTSVATALIAVEEEDFVSLYGSAERPAKGVADQRRTWLVVMIIEPVVGRGDGVSIQFEQHAVELVGSALGDQGDLCTRRTARRGTLSDG